MLVCVTFRKTFKFKQTDCVNEMRIGRSYVITTNNVFFISIWFRHLGFRSFTLNISQLCNRFCRTFLEDNCDILAKVLLIDLSAVKALRFYFNTIQYGYDNFKLSFDTVFKAIVMLHF